MRKYLEENSVRKYFPPSINEVPRGSFYDNELHFLETKILKNLRVIKTSLQWQTQKGALLILINSAVRMRDIYNNLAKKDPKHYRDRLKLGNYVAKLKELYRSRYEEEPRVRRNIASFSEYKFITNQIPFRRTDKKTFGFRKLACKNRSDCATLAFSMVAGEDYSEVYDLMHRGVDMERDFPLTKTKRLKSVAHDLGFKLKISNKEKKPLDFLADTSLPFQKSKKIVLLLWDGGKVGHVIPVIKNSKGAWVIHDKVFRQRDNLDTIKDWNDRWHVVGVFYK